jgi:uncharacterized protein with NRDE domain
MCLILFSLNRHCDYPLIIAANRDESYARPTAELAFWSDAPQIAAGRDLDAGGTWLGITRQGRWAALTNFRKAGSYMHGSPSRGQLVSAFLRGAMPPAVYLEQVQARGPEFNGFNLVIGDHTSAYYYSNRADSHSKIAPGVHGLSNHLLDTAWPKVTIGCQALADMPRASSQATIEYLMAVLQQRTIPPDHALPDTGIGIPGERILSPIFIAAANYGTRASTVVLIDKQAKVIVEERRYAAMGAYLGTGRLTFEITAQSEDLSATLGS